MCLLSPLYLPSSEALGQVLVCIHGSAFPLVSLLIGTLILIDQCPSPPSDLCNPNHLHKGPISNSHIGMRALTFEFGEMQFSPQHMCITRTWIRIQNPPSIPEVSLVHPPSLLDKKPLFSLLSPSIIFSFFEHHINGVMPSFVYGFFSLTLCL